MATPIKNLINNYFKEFKVNQTQQQRIQNIVCEVTGLSQELIESEIKNNLLLLRVQSSTLAHQVSLYRSKIIKRVQGAAIDIEKIKIKVKGG
jgi:hypothetical protein